VSFALSLGLRAAREFTLGIQPRALRAHCVRGLRTSCAAAHPARQAQALHKDAGLKQRKRANPPAERAALMAKEEENTKPVRSTFN